MAFVTNSHYGNSTTVDSVSSLPQADLISDTFRRIYVIVNFNTLSLVINFLGTIGNFINIVVFARQGFSDSVNVSLFGLAVSDFLGLVSLQWFNICSNELFAASDIPFDSIEVQYLTSGWPHVAFARTTAWITAFITFERCLCVTMPLKVKVIITPRRCAYVIVVIFVTVIASIVPIYFSTFFAWKFYPDRNRTLLGIAFVENRVEIESIAIPINGSVIPWSAFIVVIVCTSVLVYSLNSKTKWRNKATFGVTNLSETENANSTKSTAGASVRDRRVVKMVVLISIIFITSFMPFTVCFMWSAIEPEFSVVGRFQNTFWVAVGVALIMETINSSVNLILYYRMSSRYRETFRQLFRLKSVE
ncbi:galanin-like G-protein coupled receptor npr-9 [Aplysia californica]|uniref:Galanin-like G-protein coupled receptor npr-9 n=1 Tax=Aplysia californica TaxID=6500 RepID=A0ABM0JYC7_APLCA|nr:galanin-like G-protein coupled receptor npr-9 [Aplysia californica]